MMISSRLTRWKPNTAGVIIAVVLFLLCLAGAAYELPVLGYMFEERGAVAPQWLRIALVAVASYLAGTRVGAWLANAPESPSRPRARRVLLLVLAATWVAALIASPIVSKLYWGYFFARPSMDVRVADATRVLSLTKIGRAAESDVFVRTEQFDADELVRIDQATHDEAFLYRAVRRLYRAGLVTGSTPALSDEDLQSIGRDVLASVDLVPGDRGYPHATRLWGVVIELHGPDTEPLLLITASGGEASNDHHPFYEFLFARRDHESGPLVSETRFFYDFAGVEGLEWYFLVPLFGMVGSTVTLALTIVVLVLLRLRSGRRDRSSDTGPVQGAANPAD